jgi:predicted DsbA family dithiol-disulfide isomerase
MKIEIVADVVCPWFYIGEAAGLARAAIREAATP